MTAKLYGFDRSLLHDTTERDPFVIDMVRADDYLKLEAQVTALQERLVFKENLTAEMVELQEQVRALAAEKENARDVMLYAANNISYAIFNLSDKKLSDLKRGLSDTTCPTDSALLAERELRSFAARIRAGEKS